MLFSLFFFTAIATTQIYTLSLHDALPISTASTTSTSSSARQWWSRRWRRSSPSCMRWWWVASARWWAIDPPPASRSRSEEHTSELQSHSDLVCRLLLEKKKNDTKSFASYL